MTVAVQEILFARLYQLALLVLLILQIGKYSVPLAGTAVALWLLLTIREWRNGSAFLRKDLRRFAFKPSGWRPSPETAAWVVLSTLAITYFFVSYGLVAGLLSLLAFISVAFRELNKRRHSYLVLESKRLTVYSLWKVDRESCLDYFSDVSLVGSTVLLKDILGGRHSFSLSPEDAQELYQSIKKEIEDNIPGRSASQQAPAAGPASNL